MAGSNGNDHGTSPGRRSRSSQSNPKLKRGLIAAALALVVVGGLAWALLAQNGDEAAPAVTSSAALVAEGQSLVTAAAAREQAPSFSVQTASFGDGSTFNLEDSRGEVVVLLFTAAWCTSCGPETQALASIYDRYASLGIQALVVDVDTTESEEDLLSLSSVRNA